MPHFSDCTYYKVQTHLENQSRYHIQQSQRHQVKQYLTLDTKLSSQTLSLSHSHTIQPVGVSSILRNGHMPPASSAGPPQSPGTKLLACSSEHENVMEEVIEDIINMESNFNDGGIGCSETPLLMQRTNLGFSGQYYHDLIFSCKLDDDIISITSLLDGVC